MGNVPYHFSGLIKPINQKVFKCEKMLGFEAKSAMILGGKFSPPPHPTLFTLVKLELLNKTWIFRCEPSKFLC